MSQLKRSLFLNSKKKNAAQDSVIERDSTPRNSGIKSQPLSTICGTPQVAPRGCPRDSPGGPSGQWTSCWRKGEGRLAVGSFMSQSWSGVYLLCPCSADHYSAPRSQVPARKVENICARGKVQWTPAESQNMSSFQVANTYFTSLCIK